MTGRKVQGASPVRVVIDPALVLRALLGSDDAARQLRSAWQHGVLRPLLDAESAAHLVRALAFPPLKLSAEQREELLADYLPYVEVVKLDANVRVSGLDKPQSLLLQLAQAGGARYVMTECQVLTAWSRRSRKLRDKCTLVDLNDWNQVLTPSRRAALL